MELIEEKIDQIGERIVNAGVEHRHWRRETQIYETVYGVEPSPDAVDNDVDLILRRVIRARANQLSKRRYDEIINDLCPVRDEVLNLANHRDAFKRLLKYEDIGQKIANEFLRHAVHVFGINHDWEHDLHVALDTNVVQTLVKTEAIIDSENGSVEGRSAQQIVNMDPEANPDVLVSYSDVQNSFQKSASEHNLPRIIFDELWLEHRTFIANPLLFKKSFLCNLLDPDELFGD